ncbi:UNKNOWN [Stylonychia lemnae]|uniref:Uncharacterized protein n=1 Tax=Stylonychia lemnae TaxID=5949 RepID=A0A077ZTG9_STYLE|nr:UNKNOWN [Stylonychia lemnae]|eukprot:CDW71756.1 UNKNOWN [Stylonychia lemnae]
MINSKITKAQIQSAFIDDTQFGIGDFSGSPPPEFDIIDSQLHFKNQIQGTASQDNIAFGRTLLTYQDSHNLVHERKLSENLTQTNKQLLDPEHQFGSKTSALNSITGNECTRAQNYDLFEEENLSDFREFDHGSEPIIDSLSIHNVASQNSINDESSDLEQMLKKITKQSQRVMEPTKSPQNDAPMSEKVHENPIKDNIAKSTPSLKAIDEIMIDQSDSQTEFKKSSNDFAEKNERIKQQYIEVMKPKINIIKPFDLEEQRKHYERINQNNFARYTQALKAAEAKNEPILGRKYDKNKGRFVDNQFQDEDVEKIEQKLRWMLKHGSILSKMDAELQLYCVEEVKKKRIVQGKRNLYRIESKRSKQFIKPGQLMPSSKEFQEDLYSPKRLLPMRPQAKSAASFNGDCRNTLSVNKFSSCFNRASEIDTISQVSAQIVSIKENQQTKTLETKKQALLIPSIYHEIQILNDDPEFLKQRAKLVQREGIYHIDNPNTRKPMPSLTPQQIQRNKGLLAKRKIVQIRLSDSDSEKDNNDDELFSKILKQREEQRTREKNQQIQEKNNKKLEEQKQRDISFQDRIAIIKEMELKSKQTMQDLPVSLELEPSLGKGSVKLNLSSEDITIPQAQSVHKSIQKEKPQKQVTSIFQISSPSKYNLRKRENETNDPFVSHSKSLQKRSRGRPKKINFQDNCKELSQNKVDIVTAVSHQIESDFEFNIHISEEDSKPNPNEQEFIKPISIEEKQLPSQQVIFQEKENIEQSEQDKIINSETQQDALMKDESFDDDDNQVIIEEDFIKDEYAELKLSPIKISMRPLMKDTNIKIQAKVEVQDDDSEDVQEITQSQYLDNLQKLEVSCQQKQSQEKNEEIFSIKQQIDTFKISPIKTQSNDDFHSSPQSMNCKEQFMQKIFPNASFQSSEDENQLKLATQNHSIRQFQNKLPSIYLLTKREQFKYDVLQEQITRKFDEISKKRPDHRDRIVIDLDSNYRYKIQASFDFTCDTVLIRCVDKYIHDDKFREILERSMTAKAEFLKSDLIDQEPSKSDVQIKVTNNGQQPESESPIKIDQIAQNESKELKPTDALNQSPALNKQPDIFDLAANDENSSSQDDDIQIIQENQQHSRSVFAVSHENYSKKPLQLLPKPMLIESQENRQFCREKTNLRVSPVKKSLLSQITTYQLRSKVKPRLI